MRTLEDVLDEITPTPDPDFVADMEWRMRRGFPSKRNPRLPRINLGRLGPRPIAAVAASALLALVVTVTVIGGGDDRSEQALVEPLPAEPAPQVDDMGGGGAAHGERDLRREALAAPSEASAVQEEFVLPKRGGGVAPRAQIRRIERSATITLASDPAEFDDLSDAIFRTVGRRDGFVLQSSFTQGEDGLSSGFFELRVPSGQLEQTLNDLSGLATVRARSEAGTDVTAPFVSVRDRLRTAKALRTSLLNRLEVAFTDTAVDALRRRLEIVGNRIGRLREQLRGMRERTEFATVMVELVDEQAGAASGATDEAVDDAVGSLEDILNFLIRAVGILLPLALAGAIGWLVATRARKRARERTLA